jgi:peroxiredoxin Q/BCP
MSKKWMLVHIIDAKSLSLHVALICEIMKLKVGDNAPLFTGKDQNGNNISLADYKGKRVILYFYPKDNTSGCTAEACSLRDGRKELDAMGFTIIGVSPDNEKSHTNFANKYDLGFTLIADTDKSIAESYGVWGLKKFMGREYMGIMRTTFIIGADGKIEKIFDKVDTKHHFEQIADSYKS